MQDKRVNTFLFFTILLIGFSYADPQIIGINQPEYALYGEPADFNVLFDAEGQTGTMNFWIDGGVWEQRNFESGTTFMSFEKTWTNLGDKNIAFSINNLSGADANSLNNILDSNIEVKKGVDFYISGMSVEPENTLPDQTATIQAFVQNIGDINFIGQTTITYYYDGNQIGEVEMLNIAVGETKTIEFEYVIPNDFAGTATLLTQINKLGETNEYNTTNNIRNFDITGDTGRNLRVNSISFEGNLTIGVMKEFTANIENNGGETISNIVIGVYKTAISPSTKIGEYHISTLSGHTIQQISFSNFFATPGEEKLYVFVDPYNAISEFNENDNDFSVDMNIQDSNVQLDLGTYLSTLETFENEINSCQSDLVSSRLERDVALDSVANLTTERDNCESNLNSCNQNNATFLASWKDGVDNNWNAIVVEHNLQLAAKEEALEDEKASCSVLLLEKDDENLLLKGLLGAFVLFILVYKIVPLFRRPKSMVMTGGVE